MGKKKIKMYKNPSNIQENWFKKNNNMQLNQSLETNNKITKFEQCCNKNEGTDNGVW